LYISWVPSRTDLSTNGTCQLEKTENLASKGPSPGDLHGSPTHCASFCGEPQTLRHMPNVWDNRAQIVQHRNSYRTAIASLFFHNEIWGGGKCYINLSGAERMNEFLPLLPDQGNVSAMISGSSPFLPLTVSAMYCLSPILYVIGVPRAIPGMSAEANSLPVALS